MVAGAYEIAARVVDPELRVVTIAELGILRDVATEGDRAVVTITPTYSGCPALDMIRTDVATALRDAGWNTVEVVTQLRPPWTTDWIAESGRAKLAAAGIAPPALSGAGAIPRGGSGGDGLGVGGAGPTLLGMPGRAPAPACPRCGSAQTQELSRFGSTACTSLWRCTACREPFTHVKAV
jgi:ring-1,2-phenylacetyl-CoA epoxidase subunit PaaD